VKRRLLHLVVIALALLCTSGTLTAQPSFGKTTHRVQNTAVFDNGHCSATAVGRHVLLTASHCEAPSDRVIVDDTPAKVVKIVRDRTDHTFLYLEGIEFKDIAEIDTREPDPGEDIMFCGNPGRWDFLYRRGIVAGVGEWRMYPVFWLDVNGFYGDSGAGVFDVKGKLIGVVSIIQADVDPQRPGYDVKFMGMFRFTFTKEQIEEARKF